MAGQPEGRSRRKRRMFCSGNGLRRTKAKDQQAKLDQRVENLRNDLILAETQGQRVLVLQNEWQALYDQAGKETDDKAEPQPSQGDLESEDMDATDDDRILFGDSDGFLTVLSRKARKKQQKEEAHHVGTVEQEPLPSLPPAVDVLDKVDPSTLCRHILGHVPTEGSVHD